MSDESNDLSKNTSGDNFQMFIPITKIDTARHQVWGWGMIEKPDHSGEVLDWATTKPHVQAWSDAVQKRSMGKSLGNVRTDHKVSSTGRLVALELNDKERGAWVGAEIVDPVEWEKCEKGVLNSFSVGGQYAKRWRGEDGYIHYTAVPNELSLVDAPCNEPCSFQVLKADGAQELRPSIDGTGADVLVLEKAIPDAPEATAPADLSVPAHPKEDTTAAKEYNAEVMPPVNNLKDAFKPPKEVDPNAANNGDQFTPDSVKDLSADVQGMGSFPTSLKKAIREAVETAVISALQKYAANKTTPPAPAERQVIRIKPHQPATGKIKVKKE